MSLFSLSCLDLWTHRKTQSKCFLTFFSCFLCQSPHPFQIHGTFSLLLFYTVQKIALSVRNTRSYWLPHLRAWAVSLAALDSRGLPSADSDKRSPWTARIPTNAVASRTEATLSTASCSFTSLKRNLSFHTRRFLNVLLICSPFHLKGCTRCSFQEARLCPFLHPNMLFLTVSYTQMIY